jgi:hypothetical protein
VAVLQHALSSSSAVSPASETPPWVRLGVLDEILM